MKVQQTLETDIMNNPRDLSAGPLSFQGHFQRTEKTKQSYELPNMSVFRPIEPKNQMKAMEVPNKNNKPPLRIYKTIAPNHPDQSPPQPAYKNAATCLTIPQPHNLLTGIRTSESILA